VHVADRTARGEHFRRGDQRLCERFLGDRLTFDEVEDGAFGRPHAAGRAALDEEAVELRLGKGKRAFLLDRVLRRDHHEQLRQRVRVAARRRPAAPPWLRSSADCTFGGARLISSHQDHGVEDWPGDELEGDAIGSPQPVYR
jgi:hypothetical protein